MSIMTSLDNELTPVPITSEPASNNDQPEIEIEDPSSNHSSNSVNSQQSTVSFEQQFCQTCQTDFGDRSELLNHLLTHVKLPNVVLQRCDDPEIKKKALTHKCGPLRFSIKTTNNNFQIVPSPENSTEISTEDRPPIPKLRILLPEQVSESLERADFIFENKLRLRTSGITITEVTDNPVFNGNSNKDSKMVELSSLPNESHHSPGFPIQSPAQPDINTEEHSSFWNTQPSEDPLRLGNESGEKEAETHNNLLQNFLNDSVETIPKDAGLNSGENEYISLERLAEKNVGPKCPICDVRCLDKQSLDVHQKAMGHYLPTIDATSSNSIVPYRQNNSLSSLSTNPLESLANLPMQQLAQQVNRLQQGPVHQQNVLINIQQFGQPMGHPQYGRPPEMPPHYPTQHYPPPPQPQHMYGGYHHSPHPDYNHPMYYPQSSGMYPSMQMPSQIPPQMPSQMPSQMSAQMQHPSNRTGPHSYHNQSHHNQSHQSHHNSSQSHHNSSQSHHSSSQSHQTSMMPPRAPPPQQQPRMAPPPNPGQQQMRPRARMPLQHQQQQQQQQRPSVPRMSGPRPSNHSGIRPNMPPQQVRPVRRIVPASNTSEPAVKRKRMDVLIPDTNDNDDCHVISMQKCNDGMPIIKNIQGANTSTSNNGNNSEIDPVVHLTDSITLSVRNPKDPPAAIVLQKKNDAKAVANILATRGITVTPAAKTQKEQIEVPPKKPTPPPAPVAINLNNAVSIIPTARQQQQQQHQQQQQNGQSHIKQNNLAPRPPTVDLTDDDPIQIQGSQNKSTGATVSKRTLPHQCDLCPAQYPTLQSLMNHRRTYHKTGTPSELGVPVVDLRQPQVLSKLASIGVHNYIPLPQLGNGSGNFALPIVSVNASKNPNICNLGALGSGAVLPLGPLRHISNLPNAKQ